MKPDFSKVRSPGSDTLLAVAIPLVVIGLMSVANDVGGDRSFFMPDAAMWNVNWASYIFTVLGSFLILFVLVRFVVRWARR